MSENTEDTNQGTAESEQDADVEVTLDPGDSYHLESLRDEFGDDLIQADLREVVKQRVRSLNDNRDAVARELKQAEQQARSRSQ